MKNTSLFRRSLSVVLVLTMLFSLLVPVASAEPTRRTGNQVRELTLEPVDSGTLASLKLGQTSEGGTVEKEDHALTDVVRVSIVMERPSTLGAGFSMDGIADNTLAKVYRTSLRLGQEAMTAKIEKTLGSKLDVKWNLTLVANCISANVLYGQIETIKGIDGVKDVFLETIYEPMQAEEGDQPNNGTACDMIGSNVTWAAGLTGAGSRLAIIDTGIDPDHQSFSGEALEYALARNAEEKGMSYDEYLASLNLLDAEKVNAVKDQLNAKIDGEKAYVSSKIPYAYCYVGHEYDVTHLNDEGGEHGSHVEGISAANRFIKVDGEFKPALETVGTQGVAPDAQIIVMKVFHSGGAASSDYMVAIEDAIILGCDSANLSLGSSAPGLGFSDKYEYVMDELVEHGMVCTISMGNSYGWFSTPKNKDMYPYIYTDDANYNTGGSPGSFANSMTVASVNNSGTTGMPLIFGDVHAFYTESSYKNKPISTLANQELEYVLVDGVGVDADEHIGQEGDQFLALGSEVLAGKVAMCRRGSSSFFIKANAAVAQGAIAVVVINNQPGTINMALSDYAYEAPVVSILQADGNSILENSTPVTDDEGNVLYYTGTMSVAEGVELQHGEVSDTVTVSDFSSYGVPGTLVMKPEILAPGGNIYSVFGYNYVGDGQYAGGHDQYEKMSGTSMAAPQINGMAGILGQYIRENDLCEKTGLTQRQLINSLLMSTAHPVFDSDGNYWPTIRVGAGLANVADAVSAKSFVMMEEDAVLFPDTAKDGKVKAELGDDPERTGKYDFSFTVTPMEGKKEFTLRTDIFTQGIAGNGGYGMLQDTATMLLAANTSYELNGESYTDTYRVEADVNLDGETNAADAQAILDHITGEEAEGAPFDAAAADVDGDGKITSYDAKLLLDSAESPVVEVTEITKVKVHIELDEGDLEVMNYYFPKGFYVQGYTYVEPVADEEGALDVTHSIPILGYYGSWTEPSMFDRTSAIDEAYGTGKLPYVAANGEINYMQLKDSKGKSTIFMGNPYAVEDEFPAERLAINSQTSISSFKYLPIRNAATLGFAVQDEKGKALTVLTGNGRYSAYYNPSSGKWMNTDAVDFRVGKQLGSLGLKEGDRATVGFYALPEYSAIQAAGFNGTIAKQGAVSSAELAKLLEAGLIGDGAAIKYDVTVDDTAPEVEGAFLDLVNGSVTVRAKDNRYIAYVAVTNKSGTKVYAGMVPEQTEPGQTVEIPLDLKDQKASGTAILMVGDYAGNESVFEMNLGDDDGNAGLTVAFTSASGAPGTGNRALQIDVPTLSYDDEAGTHTGLEVYSYLPFAVEAAEYVDGYVFLAADDGYFYIAELEAMNEPQRVGKFTDTTSVVYDMAFNSQDSKLYVLGENSTVYTVDYNTGALTKLAQITLSKPSSEADRLLKGLAIDDNGNFYTVNCASLAQCYLYSFTLDMVEGEAITDLAPVSNSLLGAYNQKWGGCLAWDHNAQKLYMISNYFFQYGSYGDQAAVNANTNYSNCLWVIDTATGKASRANSAGTDKSSAELYNACSGLFIVPAETGVIQPVDTASSIEVDPTELSILKGQSVNVTATVLPWSLTDKSVTWASNDESVAIVQDGKVTGIELGQTTITVTTVAQPNLSVEIPVEVIDVPEVELRGIIWDVDSTPYAAHFMTTEPENWEGDAEIVNLQWGALVGDTVYGSTDSTMYKYDADTYEMEAMGGISGDWIPSDAAGLPEDLAAELGFNLIGLCSNGLYVEILNPEAGNLRYWDLSEKFMNDPMALIAYSGRYDFTDEDGVTHPQCAEYFIMTESGKIVKLYLSQDGNPYFVDGGLVPINLSGVSDVSNEIYGSMVYDEASNFLFITLCNGADDIAYLYAVHAADLTAYMELGTFNEKVWPVVGLYQYEPLTDLTLKVNPESLTVFESKTAELNVKVKLGQTNEYTVSVADPSICSYENGLVTGLKEGETTLTVTTVDVNAAGEHLSKEIPVKVDGIKSFNGSVLAQVTDGNGARFARISLDGAVVDAEGLEAPGSVSSGGRGGDIYLAGVGTATQVLDAETFQPADTWNGVSSSAYATIPALDMANYPTFTVDGELDNQKLLFTTDAGYLVTPDYKGWNLSNAIPNMAGICFAGTEPDNEKNLVYYTYYLITTDGVLYELIVTPTTGKISYQAILETGLSFEQADDVSMAMIVDLESLQTDHPTYGLAIADNGTKDLYFLDFTAEKEEDIVGMIGTVDAENVSGLIGFFDDLDYVDMPQQDPTPQDPTPQDPTPGVYLDAQFETDPANDGWTFVDKDGDENNWQWISYSGIDDSGSLRSYSYAFGAGGGALIPDNWAISPAMNLVGTTKPELSLFAKNTESYGYLYQDTFAVYAGTSTEIESMTKLGDDITPGKDWTEYKFDLSGYVGESTVYVAIRHYNCTDQYMILVDNVTVKEAEGSGSIQPMGVEESAVKTDLKQYRSSAWKQNQFGHGFCKLSMPLSAGTAQMTKLGGEASVAGGSTNAIRGELKTNAPVRMPLDETVVADGQVSITLSDDEDTTNGLMVITYDPEAMSFVEGNSPLPYASLHHEIVDPSDPSEKAYGKITVAYASYPVIPAEEAIGTLSFSYEGKIDTKVIVEIRERNDNTAVKEEPVEIPIAEAPHEHAYGEPVWSWSEDFSEATATFTCKCEDEQIVEAVISSETTEPTCTEAGKTVYTATVEFNGESYTDVQEISIDALGHAYGEPVWSWSEDFGKASATFTCGICNDEQTVEAVISSETTAPTCTEAGKTVYTATVEFNGESYTDVQEISIDAEGHAYGEPVWSWSEDFSKASATFTCGVCNDEQTVEAVISSETTAPTCTEAGKTVYTATVEFDGASYTDSKEAATEASGHAYGEPIWSWNSNLTEAKAMFICGNCGDMQTVQAEISKESVPASCAVNGKIAYTAKAVFNGKTYTDTKEIPVDCTGHVYGEPVWSWNEDYTKATAHFVCVKCGDEQLVEAKPTESVTPAAPHVAGERKLTAKLSFNGKEYSETKSLEIAALPCPCANFTDMPAYGTVEHEAIDWAYTQDPKVTNGTSSTTFSPDATLTRGDTVRFLWNAVGQPEAASTENPFTDAVAGKYYYKAMLWAYHNNPQITKGKDATTFAPKDTLERREIITFLWRAAGEPKATIKNPYSDVPAGKYYEKAAIWAYETGIYKGTEGKFMPKEVCTRAEMVVYMYRHFTRQNLAE